MNIFRIMGHRYIPPPIRPSPRVQAPKKKPRSDRVKICTQGGRDRVRWNPNVNEHTQISLDLLAHAHAIDAGPMFSRAGPSSPERIEERRKNGARTGLYHLVEAR